MGKNKLNGLTKTKKRYANSQPPKEFVLIKENIFDVLNVGRIG